jgi:hypothetical protein
MDQEIVNRLKKAAGLIKEGKQKNARSILVELLRDHPEVDQAWYMLSFTVPVLERQIYALEQALKANPNNDKALTRLLKLQEAGESPEPKAARPTPSKPEKPSPAAPKAPAVVDPSKDLLSQRLLGDDKPAPPPEKAVEPEDTPSVATESVEEDLFKDEQEKLEKQEKKKEKYTKKVFGMRRGIFLLIMLIFIFSCFGILGYSTQIRSLIVSNFGQGGGELGTDGTPGEGEGQEGVENTPEPEVTEGIDLPPVWTATAPAAPTPTAEVASNIPMLSLDLFDFDSVETPEDAVRSDFDLIREQLSGIMDEAGLPPTDGYVVSDEEMAEVFSEFARMSQYRELSRQAGLFFTGLGLSSEVDKTDAFIQNMWADPNGTLLFADSGNVLITDFNSSQYQRYSYAKSVVQNYRNGQSSFAELGYYPMCSPIEQTCEILHGLIKGEAAFFAKKWAAEYMGESASEEFNAEIVNYFTVPMDAEELLFVYKTFTNLESYGEEMIEEIYNSFGLEFLDSVFSEIPISSEQLIHPEKYLEFEAPIDVESVDIAETLGVSWQQVYKGSLGEWKTYLLMTTSEDTGARLAESNALNAAAGWGGDAIQMYFRMSTQEYVIAVEWAWDSQSDADEFRTAFTRVLDNKSGASSISIVPEAACFESSSSIDCLFSYDENLVWAQAPDLTLMTSVLSEFGLEIE